jgi:hypothetical protein
MYYWRSVPGHYNNSGDDYTKVFDGDISTYMDYSSGNGGYAGMCLVGTPAANPAAAHDKGMTRLSVATGANSRIKISGLASGRAARVEIYDLRGVIVRSLRIPCASGASYSIDACDNAGRPLSTGWYVARVTSADRVISRTVNIQR